MVGSMGQELRFCTGSVLGIRSPCYLKKINRFHSNKDFRNPVVLVVGLHLLFCLLGVQRNAVVV